MKVCFKVEPDNPTNLIPTQFYSMKYGEVYVNKNNEPKLKKKKKKKKNNKTKKEILSSQIIKKFLF